MCVLAANNEVKTGHFFRYFTFSLARDRRSLVQAPERIFEPLHGQLLAGQLRPVVVIS